MWIFPWGWALLVFVNRNFNWLLDRETIRQFTLPEREDELKAK
jgi:hypothetical protein